MSDYKETREKIYQEIYAVTDSVHSGVAADQILNLTWPNGSPMIGVIAQDQSLPHNPCCHDSVWEGGSGIYSDAQNMMFHRNFRRLVEKE